MIVVFDFDGTLANSFDLVNYCLRCVIKDNNLDPNLNLEPFYGPTEEGMIYNILKSKNKDNFYKYLTYYKESHSIYLSNLNPYVLDLLNNLKNKNIKMCLITGRSEESLKISLDFFNLNSFFEKVYTGSVGGVCKSLNILKLMDDFKVKNDEIVYIGDTKSDVFECQNVGVNILSINFDKDRYESLSKINDKTYNNFKDLEKELNRIV